MKKIFIPALLCIALLFSGCAERSGTDARNSGSLPEEYHAANSPNSTTHESSSSESNAPSEITEENSPITDESDDDSESNAPEENNESSSQSEQSSSSEPSEPDEEIGNKHKFAENSAPLKAVNKKDSPYALSLEITTSGSAKGTLSAGKSGYATVIQSEHQIGEAVELSFTGGDVEEVVLHFRIAEEYVENELNLYPDVEELHGVKRFNIFKYFEEINMLLPIETEVDTQTNTLTATTDELGTYCVIDMEKWFKFLEEFGNTQS